MKIFQLNHRMLKNSPSGDFFVTHHTPITPTAWSGEFKLFIIHVETIHGFAFVPSVYHRYKFMSNGNPVTFKKDDWEDELRAFNQTLTEGLEFMNKIIRNYQIRIDNLIDNLLHGN